MKSPISVTTLSLTTLLALMLGAALYLGAPQLFDGSDVESTDDAYVKADFTLVAPKVGGFVTDVRVKDNQPVKTGQLLALIDDRDYRVALEAAQAVLETARADQARADAGLAQQQAIIAQARATVAAGRADLVFARQELERYSRLARKGAGSVQQAQQARARTDAAQARLAFDEAALQAAQRQASVLQAQKDQAAGGLKRAKAELERARLDLAYTRISAPIDGVVGQRSVRVGAYVTAGSVLLAVVPVEQAYVVGNFRETQLHRVRPGQPVRVRVDAQPGREFQGEVDSIAPATGLEFAPIKPSNATGNFTKVVQRLPVKIRLAADQPGLEALRAGMSVVASIDTRDAPDRGPDALARN